LPPGSDLLPAVEVDQLSVRFRTTREDVPTLKGALARLHRRTKSRQYIDALRGVSFTVPMGCVFGVIGPNGAGKSTLFRAIAGIIPPTKGRITLYGRVTPLLSLGVGFDRELTGRDNIPRAGLANGLDPKTIDAHYEEIIDFADIGDAINYPMRTYSSGMFGRVAFAVAAHLDPEILLIDEALSAGDAAFKAKSLEKIEELCRRDCTVMIVSHGMEIVKELAEHCVWLQRGTVRATGDTDDVISAYLESQHVEEDAAAALQDA
jgi:ABC-type polysaccharide/polyol phosphate transport system ATPase subunit